MMENSKVGFQDLRIRSTTSNGSTPYTRTLSFVADNFMALGDSAGLTNPMSGEGIEYHFEFIKETLDAVCKALEDNDTSVEKFWPVNVIYTGV